MARRAVLSKAELEIARIVWGLGGATVRECHQALPADRKIDYKTVQTYLRRLEAKGYLSANRDGKSIRYRPKVRPLQVVRETVADFVSRLFDGDALPLVEHLIADHQLSNTDIARLRTMLNDLETEHDSGKD